MFDGSSVYDKRSFLKQAAMDLPQPPELISNDNWDALLDNLGACLSEIEETRVAIVWTAAETMLIRGLPDLLVAASCFEFLAKVVSTTAYGAPHGVALHVFLVGTGDNFPT
jgi:hypothetical protein